MQQNGLPSADKSAPPFATSDGLPAVKDGQGKGAAMPMDRPQTGGTDSQFDVDTAQTPKGGVVLLADPGGKAGDSGNVTGVAGEVPFKNLK